MTDKDVNASEESGATTEEQVDKNSSAGADADAETTDAGGELSKIFKDLENSRKAEKLSRKDMLEAKREADKARRELEKLTEMMPDLPVLRGVAKERDGLAAQLAEAQAKISDYEGRERNRLIDTELTSILSELKAKDVNTAKKLLANELMLPSCRPSQACLTSCSVNSCSAAWRKDSNFIGAGVLPGGTLPPRTPALPSSAS